MKSFWKGMHFGSLTQAFVTACWEINDPTLREKRRRCLTLYGISLAIFIVGLFFVVRSSGILLACLGTALVPWIMASRMAEEIEEQLLQQKTPGPKTEGEEISTAD